jgi:DNA-binding PadR family transcriptional regulator
MRDMLLSTGKKFHDLYGYFNKGIEALLKWWGQPHEVMGAYIRAIEEKEQRIKDEEERIKRKEEDRIRKIEEDKKRKEEEEAARR